MLLFKSDGGSFEILIQVCRMLSGTIFANGFPLIGSALKKHRKSRCALSAAISSLRSSDGIQPCMRCTLSRNTHPPVLVYLSSTLSATGSWPWPMLIMVSWPLSVVFPKWFAKVSISFEGEYPGNRMKKMGVDGPVSAIIVSASNASWLTYSLPMTLSTNCESAPVIRSGRTALTSMSFWKSESFVFHSPGSGSVSHRSCMPHSDHSSPAFSISRDKPLNAPRVSKPTRATHCASVIHLSRSSEMGGGVGTRKPLIKPEYSSGRSFPSLSKMENVNNVETMSLSLSNKPLRV
mmetsp:Transcript_7531/g.28285  ORF Transcript_7531/g.28285 Transcript_7531/m.28285 type:complete len:292 (-) Transcript_7531:5782-6657(-)